MNGTNVTGSGTIWSGVNVRPGDILQIGDFQTVITDVTDTAHLVIPPWGGGAQAGAAYTIWQVSPQRFAGAQAMADVSTAVGAWNSLGYFVFVDPALSAPDPSIGEENQYAFQPTTRKYWLKTGGVWVFQGQPGIGDVLAANHLTDVTLTASGGVARSAAAMILDVGNIKNYGAVGDGVADDTAAFQAAIAALPGGGRIFVPRGFHRITASLTLHSGLTFYGESCISRVFGLPTGTETPSHIFIDSDNLPLFVNVSGVSMESVNFTDISFSARLTPTTTPRGTATGFLFEGSAPSDIKNLTFNRCQFSNFGGYAIRAYDPTAPSANPDWNVCPATLTDCTFLYNTIGISFETDNADFWQLNGTAFFGNVYGIVCTRSGILVLNQCFGGGGIMVITGGSGTQIRDSITFIGCQYEQGTAMLQVADNMATQRTYFPIKMISCIVESPILLSASCHFISEGCRYVNNIEVTASGVLIDSYSDSFLPTTHINLVAGSSVRNYVTHGTDYPVGIRGPITDGKCIRTASAPPSGGTVAYVAGDITYNSSPTTGSPSGWVCTASGTPGTWDMLGQIGFRVHGGSPVGTVTPNFLGEELLDNTTAKWWKSIDVGITNWVALN
ncbi:hypothetical protein CO675_39450 [Bradyrhizobium sp. C9]|nr:hypothetical protein CO675_39450 [Bradyrhizobium sp. C9]